MQANQRGLFKLPNTSVLYKILHTHCAHGHYVYCAHRHFILHPHTVKRFRLLQPYYTHLNHLHSFCVHGMLCMFKKCLQFEPQCSREASQALELVSPFRRLINQHFWSGLYHTHLPLGSFLVACNARNVAKY